MRAALPSLRAAALALAASLLAHLALLGGERAPDKAAPPTRALRVALLPPPMPDAAPEPAAVPAMAARPPRRGPPAPPAVALEAEAPATPPLRFAGPASWRYRLRQNGQDGEALLAWQPQPDGHYSLRLTRQVGERSLPAWESLGRLGSAGLAPERFAQQQGGQDRMVTNFDAEGRRVSFSASPARLELPDGVQDRLSWWLQLAALVQASDAQASTPGGRWRLWVAGLRGELREWNFEAVQADEADDAGLRHLRREPLGPWDPGIELWLDPARGYWPVRLRQGDPEARGYEIRLADVNS